MIVYNMKLGEKGLVKYTQRLGSKVGANYDKLGFKNYFMGMQTSNTHDYPKEVNKSSPLEKPHRVIHHY